MPYNHVDNLVFLASHAGIRDGFDFQNNDPLGVIEAYFQFCQQNLSEECARYGITPAYIYIRARMDVNARAGRPNGFSVIAMNFGTMPELFRLFTDHENIFEQPALAEYAALNAVVEPPLDILMFQVCTQFTFYHELAHLIQLSPDTYNWIEESYQHIDDANEPFNLNRHLHEFDADLHGSAFAVNHLIEFWQRQPDQLRTPENLELFLSMGMAAIFCYYLLLMQHYQRMYYDASTHPHSLVRITYILDNAVRHAEINLPDGVELDSRAILQRAFRIANAMFLSIGENRVEPFAELFREESANIETYVNDVLIAESRKLPNLVMNRFANPV